MKKYLLLLFAILLTISCSLEEEKVTDPFEFFWREMDRKYVYFEEKGVDWNEVYATYKPRTATANREELLQIFQEIINLLKDGHVSITTQDTHIRYEWWNKDEIVFYYWAEHIVTFPTHLNDEDGFQVFQLKNDIIYINFYTFHTYFDINKFRHLLYDYSFSKGVIIDIRLNGGGSTNSFSEFASCFGTGQRTVLYRRNKTGHGHNDFSDYFPLKATGRGVVNENIPIVILTGSYTYSAANFFAAIMKTLPNVTLIGMPTGGGGSASFWYVMPNGWTMHYPTSPTYDIEYRSIESGVTPHYYILTTAEDVEIAQQTGVYPLMEFAYQYLMSQCDNEPM